MKKIKDASGEEDTAKTTAVPTFCDQKVITR
jgi:hypothetical protein